MPALVQRETEGMYSVTYSQTSIATGKLRNGKVPLKSTVADEEGTGRRPGHVNGVEGLANRNQRACNRESFHAP